MRDGGGSRGFLLFLGVLGAITTVLGIVSSLPTLKAIALGGIVVGAAIVVTRQVQRWPSVTLRDGAWWVGIGIAGAGVLLFGVVAVVGSTGPGSLSVDPWGPTVAPTTYTAFTGIIKEGAKEREGPGFEPVPIPSIRPGESVAFEGFCLSPPPTHLIPDRRWYVISGSEEIVPAGDVSGHPPAGALPQPCGAAETGLHPGPLEMKIGPEYEFIEGDRDPRQAAATVPYALGVLGEYAAEVGYAALTESKHWIGLGLIYKPATPSTFALILPSGLNRPGIDQAGPIKVLVVICFAPRAPDAWATVGEVALRGLRRPVLLGQRVLRAGVAEEARKAACSRLSTGSVG